MAPKRPKLHPPNPSSFLKCAALTPGFPEQSTDPALTPGFPEQSTDPSQSHQDFQSTDPAIPPGVPEQSPYKLRGNPCPQLLAAERVPDPRQCQAGMVPPPQPGSHGPCRAGSNSTIPNPQPWSSTEPGFEDFSFPRPPFPPP